MPLIFAQLEILSWAILVPHVNCDPITSIRRQHQLSNLHTDTSDIGSTSSTDNIQIMTSFLAATMAKSGRVPTPVDPIFPLDDCYSHPVGSFQTVHPRPHNVAPAQPRRWANPWGMYWGHPVRCYAHLSHDEQENVISDRCFCPGRREIKAQRNTRATYGDYGVIGRPIASPNGSRDGLPLGIDQEPSQASSSPVEPRSTDASSLLDTPASNGVDNKDSPPVPADAATTDKAADTTTSAAQLRAKQMAFLARQEQEERRAEQLAIQQARLEEEEQRQAEQLAIQKVLQWQAEQRRAEQLAEERAARLAHRLAAERRQWMTSRLGALAGAIARTTDRGRRTWLQEIMEERLRG
ncbi:MAG: hypothetical protein Q9172_002997 [Xanthocarpia lactea]